MLNWGSKASPISQAFSIPSNFWNHRVTRRQGNFLDLHAIALNEQYYIILSINQWSLYYLKMCQIDNQVHVSQLSRSLFFYKLLFEVKKIDVTLNETLKLKFILLLFDSVYPTRSSDTRTKYTIYPLSF